MLTLVRAEQQPWSLALLFESDARTQRIVSHPLPESAPRRRAASAEALGSRGLASDANLNGSWRLLYSNGLEITNLASGLPLGFRLGATYQARSTRTRRARAPWRGSDTNPTRAFRSVRNERRTLFQNAPRERREKSRGNNPRVKCLWDSRRAAEAAARAPSAVACARVALDVCVCRVGERRPSPTNARGGNGFPTYKQKQARNR